VTCAILSDSDLIVIAHLVNVDVIVLCRNTGTGNKKKNGKDFH
jgi:hypothetical protein